MVKKGSARLGSEMITIAQYLIDTAYFDEMKNLALGIGKHYVALDMVVRRVIERDFLGMGFSPYLMNLDRYTIVATLKEVPKSGEEFWKIVSSLPYNVWLRYAGIQHIPKKTLIITYIIPARSSIDSVVSLLEKHPALDPKKGIEVYRFRHTFYTKPRRFSSYFNKRVLMTMSSAKNLIAKELEVKEPVESTEFVRRRKDPIDLLDVIIMSYLEAKYLVTPVWTYRKIGALKFHEEVLEKHFKRHIKDRYYLGVYLKRPPNPGVVNTVLIAVISGRDAIGLAYRLSRTPYAAATCDRGKRNKCLLQFFCREEDLAVITEILNTYNIDIEKYIFTFRGTGSPSFHDKRTLSFAAYDESSKRWFGLDEAVEMAPRIVPSIIKKYFKPERIPRELIPPWMQEESK